MNKTQLQQYNTRTQRFEVVKDICAAQLGPVVKLYWCNQASDYVSIPGQSLFNIEETQLSVGGASISIRALIAQQDD